MSFLDDVIQAVQQAVSGVETTVDHPYLQNLMTKLDDDASSLTAAADIVQLGPERMGGSAKGRNAAGHTDLAHGHVVTGIKQNQTALKHYSTALAGFKKGMTDADAGAESTLSTLDATTTSVSKQLYQVNAPTVDPTSPELPPPSHGHQGLL